jgi:hypothetical protein
MSSQTATPTPFESPAETQPTQAAQTGLRSAFGLPLPVDCTADDESDLHDLGQRMVDDLQAFLADALSATPKAKPV